MPVTPASVHKPETSSVPTPDSAPKTHLLVNVTVETHKLVVLVVGVDVVHNHEGKEACSVTVGHKVQNASRHDLHGVAVMGH
jgi:hypothetical protein